MKTIWISALAQHQPRVAAVTAQLKRYGLQCRGHFWLDAADKVGWRPALTALLEARADLWLILADADEIAKPDVRYGLSLMAAALRQARGASFPVALLWNTKPSALPPLLQDALNLEESAASWQAKIVARANVPPKVMAPDHRLDVHGDERLGQWFEIGPRNDSWVGAVFGVAGMESEIDFQAVGASGSLPEKTVLEFAQQGLQLQAGSYEFTAWAVRNRIDASCSYFARVKGCPSAILFMPYAEDGEADATVIRLK